MRARAILLGLLAGVFLAPPRAAALPKKAGPLRLSAVSTASAAPADAPVLAPRAALGLPAAQAAAPAAAPGRVPSTPRLSAAAFKALADISPEIAAAVMDGDVKRRNLLVTARITAALDRKGEKERIRNLRMGQDKVGFRESARKRDKFEKLLKDEDESGIKKLLKSPQYKIPVALAPGEVDGRDRKDPVAFVLDHHHELKALRDAGLKKAYLSETFDFSGVSVPVFWELMTALKLVFLEDKDGRPIPPEKLAKRVRNLKNDPWRSIAGDVRHAGGFEKDGTPFSEFAWANFFRARVKTSVAHYARALKEALDLAKSDAARGLPGWIGHS